MPHDPDSGEQVIPWRSRAHFVPIIDKVSADADRKPLGALENCDSGINSGDTALAKRVPQCVPDQKERPVLLAYLASKFLKKKGAHGDSNPGPAEAEVDGAAGETRTRDIHITNARLKWERHGNSLNGQPSYSLLRNQKGLAIFR